MAGDLPAITLTDPQNRDSAPSPAQSPQSPIKRPDWSGSGNRRVKAAARPVTPASASSISRSEYSESSFGGRPESSSSRRSPTRLSRSLSNNAPNISNLSTNGANSQPIDPLSQHLLKRASPSPTPTTAKQTNSDGVSTADAGNGVQNTMGPPPRPPPSRSPSRSDTLENNAQRELKKGVKAVSFLSRLMGNKKKDVVEDSVDTASIISSDHRPEGTEAEVFAQPVDNMGFNPRHPQPPAYIKMRSKNKDKPDFDRMFLAQELLGGKRKKLARSDSNKLRRKISATPDDDTVWAMEFSRDGKYLAAAGTDMVVRVWQVLSSPEDRRKHEQQEDNQAYGGSAQAEHLSAPVFQSQPIWEFEGHTSTVLDLSWSKNNFLLSSSMDKTVRLWHVSRSECLCTFKHNDFVPSIAFHPKDDRFFLAGSLDSKLRLWSIPDKSVAFSVQIPDLVTAVAFTPDGKVAMAGCLNGLCMFFETDGLKYQTQMHVRSTHGKNARGSKITNIQAALGKAGDIKLLITSNDSRIRLYNYRDKSLELKLKGNENNCSQIRASFSDDGRYVVCGSEDHKAYVWSLDTASDKRDKLPMEMFEAHRTITTCVSFAPAKTRLLLGRSEDPVYDLCNPPPVTLMSRAERAESHSSSRPGSIITTPADPEGKFERPKESPAYVSRSSHRSGNVIVTADFTGKIKVFRQDCAWVQRRKTDDWDRASLFTKRGGRSSRTNSVTTKASQRSLRDARVAAASPHGAPSDRILSWRQGVASTPNIAGDSSPKTKGSSRSISPRKSLSRLSKPESDRHSGTATSESLPSTLPTSTDIPEKAGGKDSSDDAWVDSHGSQTINKLHEDDPLLLDGSSSYMFWDTQAMKERAVRARRTHADPNMTIQESEGADDAAKVSGRPPPREGTSRTGSLGLKPLISRTKSYVSQLSDERSSYQDEDDDDDDEFDDAKERLDDDGREMKCGRCAGVDFSAHKAKDGGLHMVCKRCGQ